MYSINAVFVIFVGVSTPLKKRRLTVESSDAASEIFSSPEHENSSTNHLQSKSSESLLTNCSPTFGNLFEVCSAITSVYNILFCAIQRMQYALWWLLS